MHIPRSALLALLVLGCGGSPTPGGCPTVAGDWNITGALRSDGTCTADGSFSVSQSTCAIGVYQLGEGPDGGVPIFSCTLDGAGTCRTFAGGTVQIDVALSATGGT